MNNRQNLLAGLLVISILLAIALTITNQPIPAEHQICKICGWDNVNKVLVTERSLFSTWNIKEED